jgi:hypothetical protein
LKQNFRAHIYFLCLSAPHPGGERGGEKLNLFPVFKLMIFPLKDIHQPFGLIDDEANEDEAIEHHSELAKPP